MTPEDLARFGLVSIVKRIGVAQPIDEAVLERLLIDIPFVLQLTEIVGREVIFRPTGDHDAGVLTMDRVNHLLRVAEAGRVELKGAPLVIYPVVPVHHDIVNRQMALAEAIEG